MECRLGTEDPEDSCGNDSTVSSFWVLRLDYVSALSGGSLILSDNNHSHTVVIKRAVPCVERNITSTFPSSIKFFATTMTVPPPPLQSLTPELKLTLKDSIESVLTQIIQTNSETVFFRESALLSAFRDRLSASRISIPEPVTNANSGPLGAIHAQDLVQSFHEIIPLSLYDAYQPFVARFFDKSPCPSSTVRDLLALGLPDFIAQTSGTSGSTIKSFPNYPVPERLNAIPQGMRFCVFSSFRSTGPAVKILNDQGELEKEILLTIVGSGYVRRRMGVGFGDDDKIISEIRRFFFTPLLQLAWA